MSDQLLSIGEVADSAGLAVSALRYYDEIGLIETTTRVGGKRRFDPHTIGRVNFVRRSQQAGFSLDEVRMILDDTAGGWREVVDSKLSELQQQRDRVDAMISLLNEIRDCGCQVVANCTRFDCT